MKLLDTNIKNDSIVAYSLLIPTAIVLVFVLLYPIFTTLLSSFGLSFHGGNFTLQNYSRLLSDDLFWHSMINTVKFVGISVLFQFILGLVVALLLNQPIKGRTFFRVIALIPWTIPPVVVGATWRWMYNASSGIVNHMLMSLNLIQEPVLWLSSKELALGSIIFANIWRGFPFVMLILLAGLQSIPEELYESASIDGASKLKKFIHITIPNLKTNILIVFSLITVWEFRQIDMVKTMTGGGPGNLTEILATNIYKQYFQFFQFDFASAIAIVMCAILFIVNIPFVRSILAE